MAFFHEERRELHIKIVFGGPAGARGATRLIHASLAPELKGDLITARAGDDELEGYHFLPAVRPGGSGYRTHLHLYSAERDAPAPAAIKLLVQQADALVFLADGRRDRLANNVESFRAFAEGLAAEGYDVRRLPLILGLDEPASQLLSASELRAALGLTNEVTVMPVSVVAGAGMGVFEALKEIVRLTLRAIAEPASSPARERWPSRAAFHALQRNGLLGEFDGGTWSRLMTALLDLDEGDVQTLIQRLDALNVDELEISAALSTVYFERGDRFSHGARARQDGVFLARELRAEDVAAVGAAVNALASEFGAGPVVIEEPLAMTSIHRALGEAFDRAGKPGRVFLVGSVQHFIVIRESIARLGPFEHAVAYVGRAC